MLFLSLQPQRILCRCPRCVRRTRTTQAMRRTELGTTRVIMSRWTAISPTRNRRIERLKNRWKKVGSRGKIYTKGQGWISEFVLSKILIFSPFILGLMKWIVSFPSQGLSLKISRGVVNNSPKSLRGAGGEHKKTLLSKSRRVVGDVSIPIE